MHRIAMLRENPVAPLSRLSIAALVSSLALAPILLTPYWLFVLSQLLVTVIVVCGMNVILGNAGQLALSSVAFYGLGAYSFNWISAQTGSLLIGFVGCVLCSVVVGVPVGLVALRLRGLYLSIATFGLVLVASDVILNATWLTGGAVGVPVEHRGVATSRLGAYALIACTALIIVAITAVLRRMSLGRALNAIKECEDAAAAFGINRLRTALWAFVFSCVTAAVAGALYAVLIGYLSPEPFSFHEAFGHLTIAVVGGLGTAAGPLVGGIAIGGAEEVLRNYSGVQEALYGVLILVFLLGLKSGLVGLFGDASRWLSGVLQRGGGQREE